MNKKIILKSLQYTSLLCFFPFACTSCDKDDASMPVIESVWSNMSSAPIHQIEYAYPGQTISLRGSGFSGANMVIVNGTKIGLTASQIYNTDQSIIVRLPGDVATMWEDGETYLKVRVGENEAIYEPFYVKSTAEQPVLNAATAFSSTILVPGSTLTISGTNLDGATEVYLPLVFDQKVKCEFDPSRMNTDTRLYVIVPEGVKFARGQAEIVMTKTCEFNGAEYVERLYSNITNFSN